MLVTQPFSLGSLADTDEFRVASRSVSEVHVTDRAGWIVIEDVFPVIAISSVDQLQGDWSDQYHAGWPESITAKPSEPMFNTPIYPAPNPFSGRHYGLVNDLELVQNRVMVKQTVD